MASERLKQAKLLLIGGDSDVGNELVCKKLAPLVAMGFTFEGEIKHWSLKKSVDRKAVNDMKKRVGEIMDAYQGNDDSGRKIPLRDYVQIVPISDPKKRSAVCAGIVDQLPAGSDKKLWEEWYENEHYYKKDFKGHCQSGNIVLFNALLNKFLQSIVTSSGTWVSKLRMMEEFAAGRFFDNVMIVWAKNDAQVEEQVQKQPSVGDSARWTRGTEKKPGQILRVPTPEKVAVVTARSQAPGVVAAAQSPQAPGVVEQAPRVVKQAPAASAAEDNEDMSAIIAGLEEDKKNLMSTLSERNELVKELEEKTIELEKEKGEVENEFKELKTKYEALQVNYKELKVNYEERENTEKMLKEEKIDLQRQLDAANATIAEYAAIAECIASDESIEDVNETPVVETLDGKTPVDETPVDETPTVETPVDETPTVETPVDETPTVETHVVETPTVETHVVETPTEKIKRLFAENKALQEAINVLDKVVDKVAAENGTMSSGIAQLKMDTDKVKVDTAELEKNTGELVRNTNVLQGHIVQHNTEIHEIMKRLYGANAEIKGYEEVVKYI